jgi:multiple sugar transport system substrate-binding protein
MPNKPGRKTSPLRLNEMVDSLRQEMMTGKLPADKFLPSEADLARRFHLSNNTVRKGLDVLVDEGLIEKIPKVGNRVIAPAAESSVVVRFVYYSTIAKEADIHILLEQFHRRYPHIQVQALQLPPGNIYNVFKQYMDANIVDLFTVNDVNFQALAELDLTEMLEPLDDDPEAYPFLLDTYFVNGEQLVRPFTFSPVILCYNRDHFEQARLPEPDSSWSWDDLFHAAKQLSIPQERYGIFYDVQASNRWPIFMIQSDFVFDRERRDELRDLIRTKLAEGLDIPAKLLKLEHVFPLSISDAEAGELFAQGKISILLTTYYKLNELRQADVAYEIAPIPTFHKQRTLMLSIGLAVNRKSKVKGAAKILADYLTSYEAQLIIRQRTLSIPANKLAAEWKGEESIYRPSRFSMYREIIPTFRTIGQLGLKTNELLEVLKAARLYWSGLSDKETMCRNIVQTLMLDESSER